MLVSGRWPGSRSAPTTAEIHGELLDAAHIVPDGLDGGEPAVRNGLALCEIHHAAFDSRIIGIRPDLGVEVRQDLLAEIDGSDGAVRNPGASRRAVDGRPGGSQ